MKLCTSPPPLLQHVDIFSNALVRRQRQQTLRDPTTFVTYLTLKVAEITIEQSN
jgi:hypothetical protein